MADDIGVFVTGDRELELKFDQFPTAFHDNLFARITSLTASLAARIKGGEPHKSGKLQSDTAEQVYDDTPRKISGRVFVDADYAKAGALEYGAHGRAKVSAHEMQLDHVFGRRLKAPISVMVAAHSRQMNITERKFLRGPLQEMKGDIEQGLQDAIQQAIGDTTS